ncbi:MAG: DUF2970 domain-containing protein [Thiotrichales bacterium]
MPNQHTSGGIGFLAVLKSVAAAFFGVQSERNLQRDFVHGKPIHYILVGLLATAVFVMGVWLAVQWVLSLAGV